MHKVYCQSSNWYVIRRCNILSSEIQSANIKLIFSNLPWSLQLHWKLWHVSMFSLLKACFWLVHDFQPQTLIFVRYGFLGKEVICLKFVKESQSFYYVPISTRSCMYTHCMYSDSIPCKQTVHNKYRYDAWMGLCGNLAWSVPACSCQLISGTDETSIYTVKKI